jgi:hypothetical protein
MTLRACYEMDYPAHKITCWVCDDGNSADMREMVKQVAQWEGGMTTQYVARVKTPVRNSNNYSSSLIVGMRCLQVCLQHLHNMQYSDTFASLAGLVPSACGTVCALCAAALPPPVLRQVVTGLIIVSCPCHTMLLLLQGVPHHAKAGNLNNCILNVGSTGQLIIVLDCDMLPEKCMARTVAPFFYKRTATVLREAEAAAEAAAAAAATATASAAAAATASKSSKQSSRAVHPNSDSCTCNGSCSNACATVTAVPSPLDAHCASSIVGDIETGDAPTSSSGSCSSSATDSTAATMAGADTAAGATAATTAADTADTAATAVSRAATATAGRPVFDTSVGLLQTPQAFYNLDSQDLLGQVITASSLQQSVTQS